MAMPATPAPDVAHESNKTPPRKHRHRWLAVLSVLIAAVLAAPTIICTTPLKVFCLASALRAGKVEGRASVGSLSLGWWSPLRLENFELRDDRDQPVARVPALSIDRGLARLIINRTDLGHVRIEQPTIDVRLTAPPAATARTMEQAVEPELARVEKRAANVGFDVQVVDATVRIHDVAAQRDWALERVLLDVKRAAAGDPLTVSLSAAMPAEGNAQAGQLKATARLQAVRPWLLEIDAGRVIDHVRLTPEMCNAWLKYALPVLSDVTESQGEFSLDLEGGRVPLATPASGETAGFISVHSVDVGPGPLAEQFLSLFTTLAEKVGVAVNVQPQSRLTLARDSTVEFRVVGGKVYHRGLRIELPRLTVETYGAVGFDQSLEMMAEIRLTDPKLLQGQLASLLASQPLQLPIGGTLKKPVVDTRQLRNVGREAIRDTAKELIGGKLERGLDRLLRRKSRE